jgi:hypothetical protein
MAGIVSVKNVEIPRAKRNNIITTFFIPDKGGDLSWLQVKLIIAKNVRKQ